MTLPSPTAALQQDAPAIEVCSPLGEHELSALPGIVSSAYTAPPVGREERHHGVDFSYYQNGQRESIAGEIVQSVTGGRVAIVLEESFPYGNAVIVETRLSDIPAAWNDALISARQKYQASFQAGTAESIYFLYAHLQTAPQVEVEQRIDACAQLGLVGKSGNAGVAHLHLELRLGPSGAQLDDMGYYLYEITPQQRESYLRWRTSGEFQHIDPMVFLSLK
jgi:murein DD-endopeptidase MepM/ murein hydrolase activator NlpD